ncbi:MAG: ParB N-terminal domain-containing protein [Lachnospiraceae bacterium]|nr:ParB N-terminal domain-containing protein [Lachnospiraceae bacterium]
MSVGEKRNIKIDLLLFDPENPRIPLELQGKNGEDQIIQYMVKFGNVTELMLSIAELGYSDAEPLLVVKSESEKYIVVEGNRRLAALKLLNNPSLTDLRTKTIHDIIHNAAVDIPAEVPCIVYQNREGILDYLGYRHITGVKDWGALEKARYLEQLYNIHIKETDPNSIYQKLAKMIGSRSDYVRKLHMAFMLYELANDEAYYGLEIKEGDINFSWLTTALGYTGILDFIGFADGMICMENLNKDNYKKLFIWLFDPDKSVVEESRQITKLSKVLAVEKATEKLEQGNTLDEALLFTSEPEEMFVNQLKSAKNQLQQAKLAIEQLSDKPEEADHLLEDIDKLCKTILGALRANFDPGEMFLDIPSSFISKEELKKIKMVLGALEKE